MPNDRFICSSFSSICRWLPACHQYHNQCREWSLLTDCIGYCTLWPAIEFSLKLGALLISFRLIVPKLEVNYIYNIVIKFLLEVFHYCAWVAWIRPLLIFNFSCYCYCAWLLWWILCWHQWRFGFLRDVSLNYLINWVRETH